MCVRERRIAEKEKKGTFILSAVLSGKCSTFSPLFALTHASIQIQLFHKNRNRKKMLSAASSDHPNWSVSVLVACPSYLHRKVRN